MAPRILLLSPAFPPSPGGIERTAAALAGGLSDYEVEVVAGRPTSRLGMRSPAEVAVHWSANDPPYGRRATLALNALAIRVGMRFRPQLVLSLHARAMPAARALQRLAGARSILVAHAKELREQPALAHAAVRWADAVIGVSEFSRRLAVEAGADGARLHVVHPGVTMPPAPPAPLAYRPGPATVITVARLSDRSKGHDVALEAMARLRERVPDVRWVVVGGGPLLEELRAAAESRGIADAVTFTGPIDDAELHRLLGAAHAFCLLSREPPPGQAGEGFGIAFVEAGAHGLPVVAGAIPGVLDAVSNEANGLLVDPRDPGAAAGALERVLTDLPLAQRLADKGRARAGRLEWPRVVACYREVVERVLSDRPAGRSCRRPTWIIDLVTGPRTVG